MTDTLAARLPAFFARERQCNSVWAHAPVPRQVVLVSSNQTVQSLPAISGSPLFTSITDAEAVSTRPVVGSSTYRETEASVPELAAASDNAEETQPGSGTIFVDLGVGKVC